jgi:succinyl-diaminopimelate desuccinylase
MKRREKMKEIQSKSIGNRKFEIGNSLPLNPCQSEQIRGSKMLAGWSSLCASGFKMRAVARQWHKNARPCAPQGDKISTKPHYFQKNKGSRKNIFFNTLLYGLELFLTAGIVKCPMKELLKQLIATAPTAENGELKAARVLEDYFRRRGIQAEVQVWDQTRANVTVHLRSCGRRPGLLLAAHLDVVPADPARWTFDPFCGIEKDGRILGRGATDMLGGVAAAAAAVIDCAASGKPLDGDLILTITGGEETDSCGARLFMETAAKTIGPLAGIILPEPTNLKILTAHRGILWAQITTRGRSAHGSMPPLGLNAIEKMPPLLGRLFAHLIPHTPHPQLGACTMSINQIHGGTAFNIVPDTCSVQLDIRTLPGQSQEQILEGLQALINEQKASDPQFAADLSVLRSVGAMETDPSCSFVQAVCRAVAIDQTAVGTFTTDGPHFLPLCKDIIILGPGSPGACHKPDESIEIADLYRAKEMYSQIIRALLLA